MKNIGIVFGRLLCNGENIFLTRMGAKLNAGTVPAQNEIIKPSEYKMLVAVKEMMIIVHKRPHGKRTLVSPTPVLFRADELANTLKMVEKVL